MPKYKHPTCPICGQPGEWTQNKVKYGRNYGKSYMCYWCPDHQTFVGCHKNTRTPLGTMATQENLNWRRKAHAVFDPYWKSGPLDRSRAYELLTEELGEDKQVHIGEADIDMCKRIISAMETGLKEK